MAESEDGTLAHLQQTLASDPNNPDNHYNLGLFLWKRGKESEGDESKKLKEKSAESFLASAKLNPNDFRAFIYLGHFYKHVTGDSQRAAKCYQRAVMLNPDDTDAGERLCDLLDEERKESLEISVCKEACDKSPRAFWAFRRLGFFQVHQKKWSEAIPSLQHAIRGFPSCPDLWEALGLAYNRSGMFTAALKSYTRAIELGESRIFALIESGNIQIMLGSFREGVENFRDALRLAPNNLSAQFGFASGLLSWAKNCKSSGAFNWAATLLQEATEAANTCTSLQGNLYSLWKLHGDIQITLAKSLPWEEQERELNKEKFETSIQEWKNRCIFAAHRAKKSYQRALHLSPWQSNIYSDISLSLDLIPSLENYNKPDSNTWQVAEKMALGAILLEPCNQEYWVILGCISSHCALKLHSFIRALQLDVSLAEAWAYLGKTYRELGEKLLARKALDRARSIDPTLALPWAGLSFDNQEGDNSLEESFENCLRAVQILPIAEFQVGLGSIAARSGHLLSPQVLGAIRQAVQRIPNYAESHNTEGLICEARSDYFSAINSYKNARFALMSNSDSNNLKSHLALVSINLARSLCKAGLAEEAAHECEILKSEGLLNAEDLQIYAVSLFKQGNYDNALSLAKTLAGKISSMSQENAVAAVALVSKLVYSISGKDSSSLLVQKIPSQLLQTDQMRFIVAALNALGPTKKLDVKLAQQVLDHDVASEIHSIVALGKMMSNDSKKYMMIDNGVNYLQKALHMYPNSNLIRNQISSLLYSSGDWISHNKAVKCTDLLLNGEFTKKTVKSACEIRGASIVACYASNSCDETHKFCFPSCNPHFDRNGDLYHLNRWMHREPWNQNAKYLFILGLIQKAREENYTNKICTILNRLISSFNAQNNSSETESFDYQKFIILLCASEISLKLNDYVSSGKYVFEALKLSEKNIDSFFAHLQLCRIYGIQGKLTELEMEYNKCLQKNTNNLFGLVSLKYIESKFNLKNRSDIIESKIRTLSEGKINGLNIWIALFYFACAQCFIWEKDYISAEMALDQACNESGGDSCILLCHGAICMELAKRHMDPEFISRAVISLKKAQHNSMTILPFVSFLLAKAEASLGSKTKWEKNLRLEFSSWPPEMRPAEIYFQMHLVAKTAENSISSQKLGLLESKQSPQKWLQRAIHLNPSCMRYWHVLCMS